MSILEDYDHDANEIVGIESDIEKLCETLTAVEQYGAPASAVQLLYFSNLLTSSSKIAIESLLNKEDVALESDNVKQSIFDSIKEKAAQWSATILTFFKDKGSSLLERVTGLWDSFKKKLPQAKEKLSQLANDSKSYVKAHPYRTIAAAVAACIAVIGIVSFTGRMLPVVKDSKAMVQFTGALTKKVNAIKWPFGAVSLAVKNGGKKVGVTVASAGAVVAGAKLAQLGWSKVTAEQLDRSLEKVCGGLELAWNTLAPKVSAISTGAIEFVKATAIAAGRGFKSGYNALIDEREIPKQVSEASLLMDGLHIGMGVSVAAGTVLLFWASSVIYAVYKLATSIIGKTLQLCSQTMSNISHMPHKEYV